VDTCTQQVALRKSASQQQPGSRAVRITSRSVRRIVPLVNISACRTTSHTCNEYGTCMRSVGGRRDRFRRPVVVPDRLIIDRAVRRPAGQHGHCGSSVKLSYIIQLFFTALHCMQRGLGDRKAVCLCARLSVKPVNCDKTKETSAQILTSHERSMHLVFRHEEWLVGTSTST